MTPTYAERLADILAKYDRDSRNCHFDGSSLDDKIDALFAEAQAEAWAVGVRDGCSSRLIFNPYRKTPNGGGQ